MNQQRGFPTVTELVETMLSNVQYVIPKDQQNDADKINATTVPRTTPVVDVLRDAARHHLKEASDAAVEQTVTDAIAEFNDDQKVMRGVELRHPEIWFLYPIEVVHAQLDAMMYRNRQIDGVITAQAFADWLVEQGANERTPEELHRKSSIREAMEEAWRMDDELQFVDITQSFADEYYVHLSVFERAELERRHTIETICEYLTKKLHERRPNDGLVQYGVMRGGERMEREREQFDDRWGGIHGIGSGLAAKHISDLFNILGSTFGIIDLVPKKERTGPLEGARAPIRIWLRTAPKEVTKGLGMFALLSKELEYYQAHPDSPHVDYHDHDAMLEDGWVLD